MNKPAKANNNIELSADIRNKLQAAITSLESLKAGKKVSDKLIETALKDLEKIVKTIS